MARKPRQSPPRARLSFESLEERALLTAATFSVNLYRDVGGEPGDLIVDDTVGVGESFFVEITAQDVRPEPGGLHGIAIDVAWDPDVLTQIDAPFDPSQIITPKLPAFQVGRLDNSQGTIDNLGGSAFFAGSLVGTEGPERFALLHFQAQSVMENSPFHVRAGASQIAFYPPIFTTWRDFEFERTGIMVIDEVAASSAAPPVDDPPTTETGALPVSEVKIYQGPVGIRTAPIPAAEVDGDASFFAEIIVDAPRDESPERAGSESAQTPNAANGLAAIDLSLLPPISEQMARVGAGRLLVSEVVVGAGGVNVALPVAAAAVENVIFVPRTARRIGLTYQPRVSQAAADVVFGTAETPEPESAASPHADEAWMHALVSGLVARRNEVKTSNRFFSNPDLV